MDAIVKQLSLTLKDNLDQGTIGAITEKLNSTNGIELFDIKDNELTISYNVLHITYAGVQQLLQELECVNKPDFLMRCISELRNMRDINELARIQSPFGYINEIYRIHMKYQRRDHHMNTINHE